MSMKFRLLGLVPAFALVAGLAHAQSTGGGGQMAYPDSLPSGQVRVPAPRGPDTGNMALPTSRPGVTTVAPAAPVAPMPAQTQVSPNSTMSPMDTQAVTAPPARASRAMRHRAPRHRMRHHARRHHAAAPAAPAPAAQ